MKKRPIILDCDPGHDDAIAMILAFAAPELEVLAVTTVGGNQTIAKTTNNALRVLKFIGQGDVPLATGADKPICRPLEIAPSVHGDSGLDGPELAQPDHGPLEMPAASLIAQAVERCPDRVTLVPTGPLTNIAVFLSAYPHLRDRIGRISLMGGSAVGGNWTPAAEFNILVDPEAADIVFRSGIPITMAGLDVTHKAGVYPGDIDKIRAQGGGVAVMVAELLDFFIRYHKSQGWGFAPLHDPCAVAWLTHPEMFRSRKLHVEIDICGEHTTGCTVTDFMDVTGKEPNVEVLLDVDRPAFIDLIMQAVNHYKGAGGERR